MLAGYAPVCLQTTALHGVPSNLVVLPEKLAYGDGLGFESWRFFRGSECIAVLLAHFLAGLAVEAAALAAFQADSGLPEAVCSLLD